MLKVDQLPGELLSLILDKVDEKDLYACTLINKLFYNETMPLLWRRLEIGSQEKLINIITALATSSSPGNHVRSVSVTFELSDASLLALTRHIPFVEELRLDQADNISDDSFQYVPQHCPQLSTLYLQHAFDITHQSIVALGQHCHQLNTLELFLCPGVDADLLFDALSVCTLKEIHLLLCHLNHPKNQQLFQSIAFNLHKQQHQLTHLRIQDITDDHTSFITTAITHDLVWPHLTYFSLDACDTLDDTTIIQFFKSHPQLEYLELGNSLMITDHTLDAIPVYLPGIREVRVHGHPRLTASGICRLVKNCMTLQDGVYCDGCGIYPQDNDFPQGLDKRFYQLNIDYENLQDELIWLANNAFDNNTK